MRRAFEDRYVPEPNTGCWLWTAGWDKDGYGHMTDNVRAHRYSYEKHVGVIPDGLCVCHRCDTRCCVNPDHLFLGTNTENTRDRNHKGRTAHSGTHPNSKLTAADVIAIFKSSEPKRSIAAKYGITHGLVGHIRKGRAWARVTAPYRKGAEHGVFVPEAV